MENKTNITIDDIARELNLSKTTISRSISGKGRISEATRNRVQDYIKRRNYRPNAAAKALAENKTYNLAFVVPRSFISLGLPYVQQSMSAISEEAFLHDYNILLCLSTDDSPVPLMRTLGHRKVDGVILSRTVENDQLVDILIRNGIPFATLGSLPLSAHGKASVEADHDQVGGCCAFSTDFLRSGTGPVALLGNDPSYMVNQSRLVGFRAAAEHIGMPQSQIFVRTGLETDTLCAQAVDQLLYQGVHRFLTMDDEICMRVLNHLKKRRILIPQEVQLASLSDSDLLEVNQISALRFDAAELGRIACKELLSCLNGESYNPTPLLGYQIQLREST